MTAPIPFVVVCPLHRGYVEIGWRDAGTGKLDLFRRFDLQDLSEATLFAVTVNAGLGATSTFDRQPCALIRCLRKTPT
jgi:hypothetical protein